MQTQHTLCHQRCICLFMCLQPPSSLLCCFPSQLREKLHTWPLRLMCCRSCLVLSREQRHLVMDDLHVSVTRRRLQDLPHPLVAKILIFNKSPKSKDAVQRLVWSGMSPSLSTVFNYSGRSIMLWARAVILHSNEQQCDHWLVDLSAGLHKSAKWI